MRAAFNNAKWSSAMERHAAAVTAVDLANFHAWELAWVVADRFGSARETDTMAASMARVIDQ